MEPLDQAWNHCSQLSGQRRYRRIVESQVEIVERELRDCFSLAEIALALDRISRRLKRDPQLVQREHAWFGHHEPDREAVAGDHDLSHQRHRGEAFEAAQLIGNQIGTRTDTGEPNTARVNRRADQIDHETLGIDGAEGPLSLRFEGFVDVLQDAEQSGTGYRAGQFDFSLRVQQSVEVFGLKKSNFELHARFHFVSVQRVTAENG